MSTERMIEKPGSRVFVGLPLPAPEDLREHRLGVAVSDRMAAYETAVARVAAARAGIDEAKALRDAELERIDKEIARAERRRREAIDKGDDAATRREMRGHDEKAQAEAAAIAVLTEERNTVLQDGPHVGSLTSAEAAVEEARIAALTVYGESMREWVEREIDRARVVLTQKMHTPGRAVG